MTPAMLKATLASHVKYHRRDHCSRKLNALLIVKMAISSIVMVDATSVVLAVIIARSMIYVQLVKSLNSLPMVIVSIHNPVH